MLRVTRIFPKCFSARLAGLILILVLAQTAFSQLPTATILGTVKDASGAVVPGATVTAKNTETGLSRTTTTAADGSYRLSALPVGTYDVNVGHPGFQTEVQRSLTLTVSQEAVVNFALVVGAVEQTVSVTAEAPLVNTTSGALGALVSDQKVADLPLNGRNFQDLTLLQPGITQQKNNLKGSVSSNGTWYSSNGAPVRSNNYLLDGAMMANASSVTASTSDGATLGVEGIREFRVVTNSFSAEYGMTMGSQVTLVSKSGTNEWHGSLFEYMRNSALDARNFFDYKTGVKRRRLPAFTRNQFGGSVGGPIRTDKTFFHGAYEGLRERLGVTTVANVLAVGCHGPGGAAITNIACPQLGNTPSVTIAPQIAPLLALFPNPNLPNNQSTFPFSQPTDDNYGQVRVDQTFSSNDTLFARYTISDNFGNDPPNYPQFVSGRSSRSQFATLAENRIFSPTLLNAARFSFSRTLPRVIPPALAEFTGPQYSLVRGYMVGGISISGITPTGVGSGFPGNQQKQNVFTWSDDLFYTRSRHSLKFGMLINHYQAYFVTVTNSAGTVSFPNVTSFLQGLPNTITALTPGSILDRSYQWNTLGFYGQDDFRVLPNFTLNLGLRYEFQTVPREIHGIESALRDVQHDAAATVGPVFRNMSLRNFSPRFGFAWDVMGDGKTAIRGGFAELYDVGNFGQALNIALNGTPPFTTQSSVSNPGPLTLPLVFPAGAVGRALRTQDYNMQQPHLLSYNLTVERQLAGKMALTLAYAGSRGINIVQTVDGNPTVPQILADNRQFWPVNPPRTNPNWTGMEFKTAGGDSWYNSLQFSLLKQLSHGLQFQSSYTWSKLMDHTQGQAGGDSEASSVFGAAPTRSGLDRSVADFDITQNWRLNTIYQVPQMAVGRMLGSILNGWRLSGILTLQTGYTFTPALGSNVSRSGVNNGGSGIDRPDLAPGRNNGNITQGTSTGCTLSDGRRITAGTPLAPPNLYIDPCAFTLQSPGFLGNAARNSLRGPGLANLDFSLAKRMPVKPLGESGDLEFRAEFFNLLNRVNFGMPSRIVLSGSGASAAIPLATAGVITSTSTSSRQIQFALRLSF